MTAAFSGLSAGCAGTAVASWPFVSVMTVLREDALGFLDDLGDAERLAADPVVADRVDEVARPDEHAAAGRG